LRFTILKGKLDLEATSHRHESRTRRGKSVFTVSRAREEGEKSKTEFYIKWEKSTRKETKKKRCPKGEKGSLKQGRRGRGERGRNRKREFWKNQNRTRILESWPRQGGKDRKPTGGKKRKSKSRTKKGRV